MIIKYFRYVAWLKIICIVSFLIIFYTYVGYGLLLALLNLFKKKPPVAFGQENILPSITLVIPFYNEGIIVRQKVQNTRELKYPNEKLHILWVDDGSTDGSSSHLPLGEQHSLLTHPFRRGKTAALNTAMQAVTTNLVLFTDANALLNDDCILELVKYFKDTHIGGLAGEKKIIARDGITPVGQPESFYWRYESLVKQQESNFNTVIGATGEVFCIRTALFTILPEELILDDFIQSMCICLQGKKLKYAPTAFSTETASSNFQQEHQRKVRIAAGVFQGLRFLRGRISLLSTPVLFFQFFSKHWLRWVLCPYCLVFLLVGNVALAAVGELGFWQYLLAAQLMFYFVAFIGLFIRPNKHVPWLLFPFYFIFMHVSLVRGSILYFTRKHTVLWPMAKRTN